MSKQVNTSPRTEAERAQDALRSRRDQLDLLREVAGALLLCDEDKLAAVASLTELIQRVEQELNVYRAP
ncbi:MAG: hypothetical protein ACO32I_01155 [Candidatus Limnocylindrus sp.]